jgi:hypothetical protein
MEAPQTLRRPANWQDFESLCKKLWGEIWACPEIQKNGRLGQEQSGVDVFGIPFNDNNYYGIQCKGKNEYTHSQFTEKEINDEIKKAKKFEPPLKKFYLATTALNDSEIQKFVRKKNLAHKEKGLFEIHLFAWETIVDLIDENKQTYDWYVKSQNYKTKKSVSLTFQNGLSEISCNPKFRQITTTFKQKIVPTVDPLYQNPLAWMHNQEVDSNITFITNSFTSKINLSYIPIEITIHNTGDEPIEEYKVSLNFEGEIQDLSEKNDFNNSRVLPIISRYIPTTYLWADSMSGKIIPKKSILVGDDFLRSDDIFIKPFPKQSDIVIKWKLISKDFKEEGQLLIKVLPDIIIEHKTILVKDPLMVRVEQGEIEDFIEDIKNE